MKINMICGKEGEQNYKSIFEKGDHEVIISGRKVTFNLEEAAKQSDLTIVSVPISATEAVIKQVAPYCSAIMDFTRLKEFSFKAMEEYAPRECEIGGLHPLYGEVSSVKGKSVIYCETERSGPKCRAVMGCFMYAGAKVIKMTPRDHDFVVGEWLQNVRKKLLDAYGALLVYESSQKGLSLEELRNMSPPPTRILIDLIARQNRPEDRELYNDMQNTHFNFWSGSLDKALVHFLEIVQKSSHGTLDNLEKEFGSLIEAQDEAQKLIDRL